MKVTNSQLNLGFSNPRPVRALDSCCLAIESMSCTGREYENQKDGQNRVRQHRKTEAVASAAGRAFFLP